MAKQGNIHFSITADNDDFKLKLAETRQGILDSRKTAESEGTKIETMVKRTSMVAMNFFSVDMIKNFGRQLIEITGKFQTFEAVLTNTLQSPQKAKAAMDMLKDFATTTPFQVDDLIGSFVKLANQGFVPTYDEMVKLGDLASSTGQGFGQLSEAIIGAQAGEFDRLKEFGILASKEGDKVTFTFKEQQTQVAFTASSIRDYILSLGNMQGVAGTNAQITETLAGKYSNLQNAITQMMNEIGLSSEGVLSGALDGTGYLIENYKKVGEIVLGLVATYGTYRGAVMLATAVSKGYTIAQLAQYQGLLLVEKAQKLFNITALKNPYVAITTLVVGLVAAMWALADRTTAAEKAQKLYDDRQQKTIDNKQKLIDKTSQLINEMNKETNTVYMQTEAFLELKKTFPGLFDHLDMEQLKQMDPVEFQKIITNYTEKKQNEKDLADYQKAINNLNKAKKAYEDFISPTTTRKATASDGFMIQSLREQVTNAEVELSAINNVFEEKRKVIGEMQPKEAKIVTLQANIKTLEAERDEIGRLLKEDEQSVFKNPLLKIWKKANKEQITTAEKKLNALAPNEQGSNYLIDYTKAKKDWETAKKALTEIEKDKAKFTKEQYEKARKKEETSKNTFVGLGGDVSNKEEASKKAEEDRLKKQEEANKAKITAEQNLSRALVNIVTETTQAKIDAESDGHKKKMAQIDLNYNTEHMKILNWHSEMSSMIEEKQRTAYVAKNGSDKGFVVDKNSSEYQQINNAKTGKIKVLDQNKANETKEVYDNEIKEYQTFATNYIAKVNEFNQRIETLASDLSAERQALADNGASKKELSDFDAQAQATIEGVKSVNSEMLAGMTSEMNTRNDTFVTFLDTIATAGVETLIQKIAETEQLLEEAKLSGDTNSVDAIEKYEQQIKVLKDQVAQGGNKPNKADKKEDKNELKKHKAILAATQALGDAANDVVSAFQGLNGDVFDVMGSISSMASSVGSVLSALVTMHAASTMTITTTSVLANGTILVTSQATTEGIKAVEKASVILAIIGAALQIATAVANVLASAFSKDKKKEKEINSLQTQVDALKGSYEDLEKAIDKSYSSKASNLIEEENQNLENQKKLIEEQKRLEESKKKTDEGKISEYDKTLSEIDQKLEENKERAVDVIFGEDLKSAIDNFASAYADAWTSGEDRAAAQKDVVKKMIQNVVSEIVKSNIADKVKELRESIKAAIDNDGEIDAYEQKQIDRITDDIYAQSEKDSKWADKFMTDGSNAKEQSATAGGFETMSQETASELNGTFFSMRNNMSLAKDVLIQLNETAKMMLMKMSNGESLTDTPRLVAIAVGHLEAIQRNTSHLEEMKNDLKQVKNNTERL